MTLDVYAGLFSDDMDAVASRLHEAVTARDVVQTWSPNHEAEQDDLPEGSGDAI